MHRCEPCFEKKPPNPLGVVSSIKATIRNRIKFTLSSPSLSAKESPIWLITMSSAANKMVRSHSRYRFTYPLYRNNLFYLSLLYYRKQKHDNSLPEFFLPVALYFPLND